MTLKNKEARIDLCVKLVLKLLDMSKDEKKPTILKRSREITKTLLTDDITYEDIGRQYRIRKQRACQIFTGTMSNIERIFRRSLLLEDSRLRVIFKPSGNGNPLDTPVTCLPLSNEAERLVKSVGVKTLGELTKCTRQKLSRESRDRKFLVEEIREMLANYGLYLSGDEKYPKEFFKKQLFVSLKNKAKK